MSVAQLDAEGIPIASAGIFRYYTSITVRELFPLRENTQVTFNEGMMIARLLEVAHWNTRLMRTLIVYLSGNKDRLTDKQLPLVNRMVTVLGEDFMRDLNRLRLLHSM